MTLPVASCRGGLPLRETDREREVLRAVEHDQGQEVVVPGGDEGEEKHGDETRCEQRQRDAEEDAGLAGPVDAGRLEEGVRDRIRGVDTHQVDAERTDQGGQDDRPGRVGQPDLGEQQVGGDGKRGQRHHDGAQDDREQGVATREAQLREGEPRRRGESRGTYPACHGVEDRVPQPRDVDPTLEGEYVPEVSDEVEVGEPQAEGREEVRVGLGGGDDKPRKGQEEVGGAREQRDREHVAPLTTHQSAAARLGLPVVCVGGGTGEGACVRLAGHGLRGHERRSRRSTPSWTAYDTIMMTIPRRKAIAAA